MLSHRNESSFLVIEKGFTIFNPMKISSSVQWSWTSGDYWSDKGFQNDMITWWRSWASSWQPIGKRVAFWKRSWVKCIEAGLPFGRISFDRFDHEYRATNWIYFEECYGSFQPMNRTLTGSWSDENLKSWVNFWVRLY